MKRRIVVSLVLVAVLLCGIYAAWWLIPTPIFRTVENNRIYTVQLRQGDELVYMDGYNEAELLQYLRSYTRRPTHGKSSTYSLDDVDILITLSADDKSTTVSLGNINHCSGGYGTQLYEIQNADMVTTRLGELLMSSYPLSYTEPPN